MSVHDTNEQIEAVKRFSENELLKAAGVKMAYTQEQIDEYERCKNDANYFISNYYKIITLDDGYRLINPHNFQRKMIRVSTGENRFVIAKIGRQFGKTTIAAAILLWHILFHKSYTVAILANKADSAQEILERIQMAYESLPFWLQRGVTVWNKRRVVLDNKSKIFTAATSASGIRGKSVNCLYLDEFAHITLNLQEAFFSSTYPTITSGKNTKVIITSTPKGFEMFHKFWKEATVDKDDNPIDTTLETPIPGKNGYVAIETRWNDIPGRDEEWKNLILGTISQEQFDQEYNCAFLGSSGTLISGVHLSRMVYRKPILTRQYTNVYYKPEKDRQYVAVVDTSRGVGADHNVCSVFDVTETPFKQALIIRSNQIAPQHFPEYIASACKAYNDAPVLVETNDNGQQIADALHFDLDVDSVLMTSSNAKKGQTISGGYGANARRGVKTSTAVKRIGCSTLKALIENNVLLIEDFETIQELSSFVSKGNSYEAEAGKHDDIVATLFLFAWLTTQRYFKELTNKDARGQMASDHASAMEEELAPFGFFGFEMDDADFES